MTQAAADLGSLRQALGTPLFNAGERLVAEGAVHDVRILQAGRVVTGTAAPGKCRVYIQYRSPSELTGECSCGEPAVCVHVAAVAIAAATQTSAGPRPERVAPPMHARSSATSEQRLYYLLEPSSPPRHPEECSELHISLWVADSTGPRPDNATPFALRTYAAEGHFPRYVDARDQLIVRALANAQRSAETWLLPSAAAQLLPQLIATGRVFWRSLQTTALRWNTPRRAQLDWHLQGDGTQRLRCVEPAGLVLCMTCDPPCWFDPAQGACGWLEVPCDAALLRRLWGTDIAPADIATCNEQIAGALPALCDLQVQRQALLSVRGRVRLTATPSCELELIYNDLPLAQQPGQLDVAVRVLASPGMVHQIERDREREARLQAELQQAGAGALTQRSAWLTFLLQAVPVLQQQGWEVHIDERFPYRIVPPQQWYAELQATHDAPQRGGQQWFDLRLGVTLEDTTCNLLPVLVNYLQMAGELWDREDSDYCRVGEWLLLRLPDGRFLPVPMARIERIAETLVELFDADSLNRRQALSLPASQAGLMLLLTEELPNVHCNDTGLQRLLQELRSSSITACAAPPGFQATLRHYQEEGVGWLQFLRRCGVGGILADDMGLGKTVQTLAHLLLEKHARGLQRPSLIVAPVSVLGNWQRELRRCAPELSVVLLHGQRRRECFAAARGADVVVTGYPQLQLDSEFLLSCEFELLVLDEAQMIKNPRTKAASVARSLRAAQRLCLTGTPLENHLGELWSLLEFTQPGLLGDEAQFQRLYRTPIEKEGNVQRAAALGKRIAPFVLRRTKQAVAAELPAKTQIIESIVFEERQRDFYDAIRLAMHQRVAEAIEQRGLARSHIAMLDALLKLRQACCDPRLVKLRLGLDADPTDTIPSAKLQWLMNVLPELAAEGRRVLLFSQFTSMLALIEAAVQQAGIDYCLLTGATEQRTAVVERFQSGAVPLFLISLKAGGTGLNLTAADTVIHYDPWWNPAVEAQATDRAHRIGQLQPVFVYKLIAQDTVEEKILQLQADKHALADQLYAQQAAPGQLSAADLVELLAP